MDGTVLHLDGAILAFACAIQGFGHPILKFTIIKQFNAQEWCQLAHQLTRFLFVRCFRLYHANKDCNFLDIEWPERHSPFRGSYSRIG